MNALMTLALSNIAMAAFLALVAWGAGRCLRRPAITHGLWLLVFIKLLTPPVISIPVISIPMIHTAAPAAPVVAAKAPAAPPEAPQPVQLQPVEAVVVNDAAPPARDAVPPLVQEQPVAQEPLPQPPAERHELPEQPRAVVPVALAPAPPIEPKADAASSIDWSWLPSALGWTWFLGAILWLTLATVRIIRFHRLLRLGKPAPDDLRHLAKRVAARLEVKCPRLVLVPGAVSPMLWVFGAKPRLVLPAALVERLTPEQWRTLLAHELAHWRRRDHLVRWLELAALSVYWWCPLVWWAKQQLQEAEEECCDAWVVSTLPGAARAYALALVETVDFLSGARAVLPPAASGLGHVHLLRRRLTMILRGRTPRALTLTGLLVVLTLGIILLPLAPTLAQETPRAEPQAAVQQADNNVAQDNAAQKEDKADEKPDPDKARQDLQKLQDEFIKLQRKMEQRRREFEQELQKEFGEKQRELGKQMQEAMRKAGFAGGGLVAGAPPGGLQPLPFPQPGAFPPAGLQPGAFPGGLPPFGGPRPDLERRLDELERKLDTLLDKLGGNKAPPNRKPADTKESQTNAPAAPAAAPAGAAPVRNPAPALSDPTVLRRE